jgi:outer membrane autotransporter protein
MRTPHIQSEYRHTIPQAEIINHRFFAAALGVLLLLVAAAAPALAVDGTFPYNPITQPNGTLPPFSYWDGTDPPNNGVIGGGSGTWNLITTANWTTASGLLNSFWIDNQGGDANFQTVGGIVTVDDAVGGQIQVGSLHFTVNGYQIGATAGSSLGLFSDTVAITVEPGMTATISAPLTDPVPSATPAPGGFTKMGTGTLILSGTNTYTGDTNVFAGILNIQNSSALGATTAGTIVQPGATLQLQGGISVGNEELEISGAGAAGQNGALVNVSGTNNYGGLLILDGDTTISSDSGTLNLTNTGTIIGDIPLGLTLTGAGDGTISSIIGSDITTLTKNGTGTWTLFGDNTYTGTTTVNGGTLRAGAINILPSQTALTVASAGTFDLNNFAQSIGSLAGAGSVTLGTATLTTGNDNTSTDFSGAISGVGGLTKVGTGTLTLTGANTYTGTTMVDAGTLLVDGSLVGSAVTVTSGATLGGIGTAAGAVTIADGGILAPGNSPSSAGTFTVGSLSLGNTSLLNYDLGTPGVIGSGVNDLTIVTGNLTLDGVLNTNARAGFGPGTYRLFNYGGALTDNTLDIGTVPAGFSASNFIVVTGLPHEVDLLVLAGLLPPSVQFWDGPHTTPNGVIDGGTGNWNNFTTNWTDASGNANSSWLNGVAVFAGTAGTVTVTQPIFFAGLEFMTSGYQINQGAEGSLNLIDSPIITTDAGVTATINAPLAGEGGITKDGAGTLVLNGANTYLGNTTIDLGSLIVDGSIASAQTFVNPGGLLGGGGMIGGSVLNSGIVSPGHSPGTLGTLTVNGNYTQTANGTLRIEIAGTAPGQFDLLAVGGHASLAGTLQLLRLGNFQLQVGDKITFLTAGDGVSGSFDTVQNPFISNTLVKAQINIFDGVVQLEGTQSSFTEVACNPNTLAVARALDSAVGDPRAANLIGFLDSQPLNELCPDLELISPEELASIFNIGVSLANIQTVNLERRMDDIRAGSRGFSARGFSIDRRVPDFSPGLAGPTGPEGKSGPSVMQPTPQNRWGVFVTGLGEFTSVDDTSIAPGYDLTTGGVTLGVDYRVGSNFAIGLTGGYAHTNADLVNNGNLEVDGGKIGLYATAFGGGFYVDAAVTGGFNNYDIDRTALLGTARGSTEGAEVTALVATGYDWKIGGLSIGPVANFQYTYVDFDSFTESGSLAPLKFNNQNADSIRTSIGLKTSYDWKVGSVVVRPEIRAAWQHEFGDTEYSIVSSFANGAGNSFTVNGPQIGRDSLLIGAGAAVLLNDRVSIYAYYDGELARTNYSSNNVSAGLRVTF